MIPHPFPGNSKILFKIIYFKIVWYFLIFMEEDASNGIMPLGTDAQTNTVQTQGQTKDSG